MGERGDIMISKVLEMEFLQCGLSTPPSHLCSFFPQEVQLLLPCPAVAGVPSSAISCKIKLLLGVYSFQVDSQGGRLGQKQEAVIGKRFIYREGFIHACKIYSCRSSWFSFLCGKIHLREQKIPLRIGSVINHVLKD